MLRFSIRDLLWLTLVAAVGLGWWINHEQWMGVVASLERSLGEAKTWRTRAGVLEQALKNEDCGVVWHLESSKVSILRGGASDAATSQMVMTVYSTDSYEPSVSDE